MSGRAFTACACACAVAILPVGTPALAQQYAQTSQSAIINACAAALQQDHVYQQSDDLLKLAITTATSGSSGRSSSANGGASYGPVSASGGTSSSEQASLEQSTGYQFTKEQAASYIASKLSGGSYAAFNGCIDTIFGRPGLHITVGDVDQSSATIHIKFVVAPNQPTLLRTLHILTNGRVPAGQAFKVSNSGYDQDFQIAIANPAVPLKVQVSVWSGDQSLDTRGTTIPVIGRTESHNSRKQLSSDVSSALCGGYHHTAPMSGNEVSVEADDGYRIDLSSVSYDHESIPGDRLSSPGSWFSPGTTTPDRVSARAECVVPDGNNFFAAAIKVKAFERSSSTSVVRPKDNGRPALLHTVTQCSNADAGKDGMC